MAKNDKAVPVASVAPQRVFKTAKVEDALHVWKPGQYEANGHNCIVDWRDPDTLAIQIGTDADALANVFVGTKGGVALARSEGTKYGAFVAETADGKRWYVKVSADLVKTDKK